MAVLETRIVKVHHIGEKAPEAKVSWWCGTCERTFNSPKSSRVTFVRKAAMGKNTAVQLVLTCLACGTSYLFEGKESETRKAKLKFKKVIYVSRGSRRSQVVEVQREVVEFEAERKEKVEERAADTNYRRFRM